MKSTRILLTMFALLSVIFSGCQTANYKAEEVSRTMSYPLIFTDTIEANAIEKVTQQDGTVIRKAGNLVHTTTIFGFTRTSKYKGAELQTEPAPAKDTPAASPSDFVGPIPPPGLVVPPAIPLSPGAGGDLRRD